jgi:phosphohistidine phosphatase
VLLYLVRHGQAGTRDPLAYPDDRDRPLTAQGERRFARVAAALPQVAPHVDVVLSSRLTRAWRTAEIAARDGGWPAPLACAALEPDGSPQAVLEALRDHAGATGIGLVGHEPSLSGLVGFLLFGGDTVAPLDFKKGGLACIEFDQEPAAGAGRLRWFLPPKLARRLA